MKYQFTIFIPAYNRSSTLPRLLASLANQTFSDFECIVVDDGSSDETPKVLADYARQSPFPIQIIRQENAGKHVARNRAIAEASGEFFFTVDSDDTLVPTALESCITAWKAIPESRRHLFAGVEGLCVFMHNGTTVGDTFPTSPLDSDHISTRYNLRIQGDKCRFIRTSVFRRFPFPETAGETFIAESVVWNRIGMQYLTRYINSPLINVDYQPDGLSARSSSIRARNPLGAMLYYSEFLEICRHRGLPLRYHLRATANLVRYSLHARRRRGVMRHFMNPLACAAMLLGTALFFRDRMRM